MKHTILKSNLAKPIFYLFLAASLLSLRIEPAQAHRVNVFARVEGDTVYVESKFSGGKKVNAGKIIVSDPQGVELVKGTTNAEGEFSFKIPKKTALRIVLLAGAGHRAEWRIPLNDIEMSDAQTGPVQDKTAENQQPDGSESRVPTDATKGAQSLSELTEEDIQVAVEKALEKKLKPVMKLLAESQQTGPTAKDIFSGIGYILGLVGIVAYIHSRRHKK